MTTIALPQTERDERQLAEVLISHRLRLYSPGWRLETAPVVWRIVDANGITIATGTHKRLIDWVDGFRCGVLSTQEG